MVAHTFLTHILQNTQCIYFYNYLSRLQNLPCLSLVQTSL